MLREMLRSKIRGLVITGKNLEYEGSITLDADLLDAAEILPGEKVHVLNLNTGARIETYTIAGGRGTGEVVLNGPAARTGEVGDRVIVLGYVLVEPHEAATLTHRVVAVDERNRVAKVEKG